MKRRILLGLILIFAMSGFVSATPDCTDSDGGIEKFIWGNVIQGKYSLSSMDVCEGGI